MRKYKDTLVFIFTAGILFAAFLCQADGRVPRIENRFLFVIDTSSAMRSRTNGIEQAVVGLLKSNMHDQLRKGDTIGLWTYNDILHDEFPRQVWSDQNKGTIIFDVERYLHHEHYEKRAHLDKILSAVGQVIQASERLTIIFVNEGSQPIRGTPFDDEINGLQKEQFREFRNGHLPMVTVLVARNGEVYDYSVDLPTEIKIPKTAVDLPPPPTNAPATNIVVAPPPPPEPHRRIEIVMHGTNTVTSSDLEANTPPAKASNIVMAGTPPPVSAPSNPVVLPTPFPKSQPVQPVIATPVVAVPVPSNPSPASLKPAPVAGLPAPNPTPPVAVQSEPVAPPVASPLPPPAPALATVPAASTGQQVALFVIAISLLTIAVVLVIFLIRRSRGNSQSSPISRPADRGQ
ncbi:MAG TPA: hypothetical protein VGN61_00995 [Verrucomicrobiae bacterium]